MKIISSQPSSRRQRSQERIGELAVLPIFYKLQGQRVLLAGGSDAAAWKAHLLAASGAFIEVYAETLDPAFAELLEPSQFHWHQRPWAQDSLDRVTLAIADAASDGEAQAFYCAARAAGVPVNVIDRPTFCQFQFGSIVNRSPAIVSISTDGAAPIFGQAIRRRIETLLPASISGWAQIAKSIRNDINTRLEPGAPRRRFWERFVDRAFSGSATRQSADELIAESTVLATDPLTMGRVTLVGAGPGDAELLTLKAVRALQAADVILFDDLVSSDVLELARREAQRMLVGKRGGRESCRQEDINATMVKLAKSGKHVVRLKGGDPMIFGRAGEEIAKLQAERIPVSIVPGITSALAMASSLGVSLTHRDFAQSVQFVTGHSRHGKLPDDLDWTVLSNPRTTKIFYMGGRTAAQISQKLLENGIDEDMPCAISAALTRQEESKWCGTVGELRFAIAKMDFEQPILIGVGEVFADVTRQSKSASSQRVAV